MRGVQSIEYSFPKIEKMGSLKEIIIRGSNITGYYFKEDTKLELIDLVEKIENSIAMYFYKGNEIEVKKVEDEDKFYEEKEEVYEYGLLFTKEEGLIKEEASFVKSYIELKLGREGLGRDMVNNIDTVEFMLGAEGVDLEEYKEKQTEKEDKEEEFEYFYPNTERYKNRAKIRIEDNGGGDLIFVLAKGSKIMLPNKSVQQYKGSAEGMYERNTSIINDLYTKGKITYLEGREYELLEEVTFGSPSAIGILVAGIPVNGWDFFEGIRKYKN